MTPREPDRSTPEESPLVHCYVDGALEPRERVAVEALLAGDASTYDRAVDYQHQNVLLQALYPRRLDDRMLPPPALPLAGRLRQVRFVRRAATACVALVAVVTAAGVGWQAQAYLREFRPTPVVAVFPQMSLPSAALAPSNAASEPLIAPPQTVDLPAVVPSTPGLDNPVWRGGDAAAMSSVHPPNLLSIGYQLVDGRADLTAYGPVIRFAYEPIDGAAHRLALTVAQFGADRQSFATSINPQHSSLFWNDRSLVFALSGNVEPARLLRVAEAMTLDRPAPPEPTVAPTIEVPGEEPVLPVQSTDDVDLPEDT
ncbi:MAG: hypothetical protein AAFX81_10565 [Pseudomonadota bacterium]